MTTKQMNVYSVGMRIASVSVCTFPNCGEWSIFGLSSTCLTSAMSTIISGTIVSTKSHSNLSESLCSVIRTLLGEHLTLSLISPPECSPLDIQTL